MEQEGHKFQSPPDTSELEHKETAAATLVKRETEAKDG